MSVADLSIRLRFDTSSFQAALKRLMFQLWAMQYGDDYDRATVRVVTAIGLERAA